MSLERWAAELLGGFAAAGVTDIVISPGSRSTPFVLAAEANSAFRLHDVIDERTAAFFALGQAKVTGRPALLLCTSGTAAAHYFPAVIEAALSATPLLVLTADRPFALQGCAAPQTIDQLKLFGDHARAYVELGLPDGSPAGLRAVARAAVQAVHTARWPRPGAVQINARAAKPLEPASRAELGPALLRPPVAALPRMLPDEGALDQAAALMAGARRGVIVCGPGPLAQVEARRDVMALAAATGFPILAEAASQLRFGMPAGEALVVGGFDRLLRRLPPPDFVVQLGAPPTSSAFEALATQGVARVVLAPHGWNDPTSNATALITCQIADGARGLTSRCALLSGALAEQRSAWRASWADLAALASREIEAVLAGALTEGEIARATVASVPADGLLSVGNSLAIRHVDAYAGTAAAIRVLSQRGASGIDGLISAAAGAASTGAPTTLLLGDVSFLHDLGGLALCRALLARLVIVVIHNDGGRIFEQLPVASLGGMQHFTTPHGLSFGHAAALFGLGYRRVESRATLASALAEAQVQAGTTVIEAVVPPGGAAELARTLEARLDAALAP